MKIINLIAVFLLFLSVVSLKAQIPTSSENYIRTTEYLEPISELGDKKITIMYFDGLGREKQLKQIGASPNGTGTPGDLVTHFDYDGFGRQVVDFLPIPISSSNLEITGDSELNGNYYLTKYGDQTWFSKKEIENSPLNRVMKQAAPGDDWMLGSGNEIEFEYETNTASEVRIYWMDTGNYIRRGNYPGVGDYYPASSLYKTVTTDENGNLITEYKDKQGRVVMKRAVVEEGTTFGSDTRLEDEKKEPADTYYIYDIYGNLVGVVPPLAADKTTMTGAIQSQLCYTYKYDDRNRLVEKRLPGKEIEFMVYDKQDRLVATQDAVLRADEKWLFTKYDKFGRVVYTGLFDGGRERDIIQNEANQAANNNNETRSTSVGFTKNGLGVYYSTTAFPASFSELLSVNYYDNYANLNFAQIEDFDMQPVKDGTETVNNLKGMATASFIRIIGTDTWEKNFTVYDLKSRPVGSYKINHLGGFTKTESLLDFRGKPLETETRHKRISSGTEIKTYDYFTYDNMERLTKHTQSLNNSTTKNLIADHQYDRLGQLITKKVGGIQTNSADRWQEIDYQYNIRGWLTDINDVGLILYGKDAQPPTMGDDLFAFKIQYNTLANGGSSITEPLYNGNIAQTFWKSAEDNILRGYHYTYDQMNRLRRADFYKQGNANITAYGEFIAYDLNGNIKNLVRSTGDALDNEIDMDNLTYTYQSGNGNSNRLMKVTEGVTTGGGTGGFNNGTSGTSNDYTYDDNGNMLSDLNKGITSITYNHLNLPTQIYWAADKKIDYLYNAAGQKVKKTVRDGSTIKNVEYLDGFQYAGGILQFFPTAEGYVDVTTATNGTRYFNYVYNYTDHLGNVRMSYTLDSSLAGGLKILDETQYYPFGLKHKMYAAGTPKDFKEDPAGPGGTVLTNVTETDYQYKYNGKEFQDELGLNMYDMDMRQYDPAIGRWIVQDPVAHFDYSPYNAFDNNPVFWADPSGADAMSLIDEMWKKTEDGTDSHWENSDNSDSNATNNTPPDWFVNTITGDVIHAPDERKGYESKLGDGWEHLAEENKLKPLPSEDGQEVGYTDAGLKKFLELNNLKLAPTELLRDYTIRYLVNGMTPSGFRINVTQENIIEVWLKLTYVESTSVATDKIQVLKTTDVNTGHNSIQRVQTTYSNSIITRFLAGLRDTHGAGSVSSAGNTFSLYVGWDNYPSNGPLIKFK